MWLRRFRAAATSASRIASPARARSAGVSRWRPEPGRIGVLIVNLGTPDAPDAVSVRRYLKEFLSDPRVIENQGPVWQLILNGVILRIRPRRKARDYASIWNTQRNESPLKTVTRCPDADLNPRCCPPFYEHCPKDL